MSLTRNCQSVQLIANVGKDPEMKYLASGTPVTNLNVATNRQYKDGNGQQVKETTWWKIAFFGKLAEIVAEYATTGRQVVIEGCMRPDPKTGGPRIWEKRDGGGYGASFELIGEGIKFLGKGNGEGSHHKAAEDDLGAGEAATSANGWDDDEEIPL